MPADLTNPFGPSCCDGGECSAKPESAQPCGCDPGASWRCAAHRAVDAELQIAVGALQDICSADNTSTVAGAVAIAASALIDLKIVPAMSGYPIPDVNPAELADIKADLHWLLKHIDFTRQEEWVLPEIDRVMQKLYSWSTS